MTDPAAPSHETETTNHVGGAVALLTALLLWRVCAIMISPLDLGPDEAQYWRWGQSFDWGYYSKPPLIAWVIGSVTGIFGDSAWAVRLPAPFLHTLVAALIFAAARRMQDTRTGVYAVLIYILMPGVTFSSGLMTTDSILFVFWALALWLLWRMRSGDKSWQIALGLGLAIGAGFLAKYAMIYFCLGLALTLIIDKPTRSAFGLRNGALALLGALFVLAPHIGWNIANDLQTVSHTADNANWSGELFHPEHAVKFLVDQMGVFGPVSFLTLLTGIALTCKRGTEADTADKTGRWLICFVLPALLVILVQAVTSRAHANWAATAYVAGSILVARWMASERTLPAWLWYSTGLALVFAAAFVPDLTLLARVGLGLGLAALVLAFGKANHWRISGLLWGGLGLHLITALVFTALAAGPLDWANQAGLANAFKRTRGWVQTTQQASDLVAQHGASAIVVDERENWHGLDFYGRETLGVPVYAWPRYASPKSYADQHQLGIGAPGPVLIASVREDFRPRIRADFEKLEAIGYLDIPLGGNTKRAFKLYLGYGYKPLARTPEWTARFEGQIEK
ncbi:MAG: glycosyltransferase family 39 protein [Hyphomonadaceae bacterium]